MDPDSWGPISFPFHVAPTPLTPFSGLILASHVDPLQWLSANWGQLLVLLVLLLIAAFASGSETALTSVEKLRIRHLAEQGVPGSRYVDRLMRDPNQFLTAILILNMVTIVVASGLATGIATGTSEGFTDVLISLGFSIIVLIVAEIIPKSLAIRTSEKTALRVAPIVAFLARLLAPFVVFFRGVTNAVMRLFGVRNTPGPFVSDEQLVLIATLGEEQGVFREEERRRIEAVVEFDDIAAHEVMVPRVDITAVPVTASLSETIDVAIKAGHSRVPVYETTIDNIVGVLYVWDMLRYATANRYDVPLNQIMRQPYVVPESKSIGELFRELQQNRVHMAILLDEYGGTAGLVTIEDLLEQLVGEITDEHDPGEPQYVERVSEREYVFDGRTGLDEVNEEFGTKIESEEFDTVGGLVFHNVGHVPLVGDEVHVAGLIFRVERMEGTRISKVRVVPEAEQEEGEQEGSAQTGNEDHGHRSADVPTVVP